MQTLIVLICTHNRVDLLEKTLASLNAARRPLGWDVGVLVMANACSDGTHRYLDGYRAQCLERGWLPLEWFAEPVPGKSNALNSAFSHLAGDVVAFVDDDHRVDTEYLKAVCETADQYPKTDLFCGRILPDWDGSEPAWVHDEGPFRIYPLPVPRFDLGPEPQALDLDTAIPGGGNLVARIALLPRVGPFDTAFGPTGHDLGGAEDLEWVRRALRVGATLRYAPDIIQNHYVDVARLTLPYLVEKAFKRSASSVRLYPERLDDVFIPAYMLRKSANYLGMLCLSWRRDRGRFYLVRLAAVLGEIQGHIQARRVQRLGNRTSGR
jgi:GT2 family glycosyltransferase